LWSGNSMVIDNAEEKGLPLESWMTDIKYWCQPESR